jgi:hypothetical protein
VERRRYKRFDVTACNCKLLLARGPGPDVPWEDCTLLNLSFGGMGLRANRPMDKGAEFEFLLDLRGVVQSREEGEALLLALRRAARGSVYGRARVVWVHASDWRFSDAGTSFLESNTGWLGPEESAAVP